MRKWKKAIAWGMALTVCALCFSGCGKGKSDPAEESGVLPVKVFMDAAQADPNDSAWFDYVEKEKGIRLSVEVPPSTSYVERLQIMLASGEYPDLVLFKNNGTEFMDAAENGVLLPLDDYLPGKENLMKYTYDQSWDAMKSIKDDKTYGIPRSTMMRKDGYFIRADWLRNLGMEVPEDRTLTLSQFREILQRFTYDDPDGNGSNDTYGIASYNDATKGMLMTVEETFHLFGWQKSEGGEFAYMDPKYSKTDDAYKKAMEFNAQLFKDKLIDPDAPTITTYVNSTERFKRGITGVCQVFPAYYEQYVDEMRKINPEVDICMVTNIVDDQGSSKVGTPYSSGFFGLYGITTSCKDPEKVVDLLDWMLSDQQWPICMYGMEGICYNTVDGKREFNPENGVGTSRGIVRRNTDSDFYLPWEEKYITFDETREALSECMDNAVYSLDRAFMPSNASDPMFLDQQTELAKITTKILLGEEPVSAYDAALDQWYANGGQQYVQEMNDYIKKMEAE